MRIIGYGRVSSREQAENSHALEQQLHRLKDAGASELFSDVESGTKDERKSLNVVIDLVKAKAIDEVVVTRLDRLTRSLLTLRKVLDVFREHNVNLRALDDSIDLSTAAGKFHLNMLGALAEMEVDRLSERVKHGWAHLRERKVAMNAPFGYVKMNDRHELDHTPFLCLMSSRPEDQRLWGTSEVWGHKAAPAWDETTPPAVEGLSKSVIAREIIEAFFENRTLRLTLRAINERYGIQVFAHNNEPGKAKGGRVSWGILRFSTTGLRTWLTNPVLQGHLSYLRGGEYKGRAEVHYNTHSDQRIITDQEATEIQAILSHNYKVRGYGATALKYPLSGLIFCAECRGSCYSMKGSRGKSQPGYNYYFQCKNWRTRSCSQKAVVRMDKTEEAVIDALIQRTEAIHALASQPAENVDSPEAKALRAELAFYESAPGHRAEAIKIELRQQIQAFQQNLQHQDARLSENRDLLLQVFSDRTYWTTLLDEEKRQIYRALVEKVIVRDGGVEQIVLKV